MGGVNASPLSSAAAMGSAARNANLCARIFFFFYFTRRRRPAGGYNLDNREARDAMGAILPLTMLLSHLR